jgi:CBS domain-containing protein
LGGHRTHARLSSPWVPHHLYRGAEIGRLPGTTKVSEVMTANPKAVHVEETIENLYLMREFGFRHLPIVDGKELKGLVSSRDILLRYISLKEAEQRRMAV